jgi:hypothetical protein
MPAATAGLPGTRRYKPIGRPAIRHATPAPERIFREHGLTYAYCFSKHSYSAGVIVRANNNM